MILRWLVMIIMALVVIFCAYSIYISFTIHDYASAGLFGAVGAFCAVPLIVIIVKMLSKRSPALGRISANIIGSPQPPRTQFASPVLLISATLIVAVAFIILLWKFIRAIAR